MLDTPFGTILLESNGNKISYKYEKLENIFIGQLGQPIFAVDKRYKISVDLKNHENLATIKCLFDKNSIFHDSYICSGERLALKTWEKGNLMFSIGTEDEIDGLIVCYLDNGIEIHVKNQSVSEVVFGIAWIYINNYEAEEIYTWFADDPTYY